MIGSIFEAFRKKPELVEGLEIPDDKTEEDEEQLRFSRIVRESLKKPDIIRECEMARKKWRLVYRR